MARNRTRFPWGRGTSAAGTDASFFEDEARRRPLPDSPEVSVFSPAEEAESHARWNRAMLRERLRGPMSRTEQLGLGISAAALMALVDLEQQRRSHPDGDAGDGPGVGDAGDVLFARGAKAAVTKQMGKAAAKAVEPTQRADVLEAGDDLESGKGDGGGAGSRRIAARGGGTPFESRLGSVERTDAAALRKAEAPQGEARAPVFAEGVPAAIRGFVEGDVLAMGPVAPELREGRDEGEAERANTARAERGRAPAEAEAPARAKATDAPPSAAEARTEQRQGPVETSIQGKIEILAVADAKAADHGRNATEAPGPAKAQDAAVAIAESEPVPDRGLAEPSGRTEPKGVAQAESDLGHRPAKSSGQPLDVGAAGAKTEPGRGTFAEAPAQAKPKDALLAGVEATIGLGRGQAGTPEHPFAAGGLLAFLDVETAQDREPASAGAPGQPESKDVTASERLEGGHGRAEASGQAKAIELPTTRMEADQQRRGPAEPAPRQAATDAPAPAPPAPPAAQAGADHGRDLKRSLGQSREVSDVEAKSGPGPAGAPVRAEAQTAAVAKPEPDGEGTGAPGPARAKDGSPIARAEQSLGPGEAAPPPSEAKITPVATDKAEQRPAPAETPGRGAEDALVLGETRVERSPRPAEGAPQQAQAQAIPPIAQAEADPGPRPADTPLQQAKTKDAPSIAEAKAGSGVLPAQATTRTVGVESPPPMADSKADGGGRPAEGAPQQAQAQAIPPFAVSQAADPEARPAEAAPQQAKGVSAAEARSDLGRAEAPTQAVDVGDVEANSGPGPAGAPRQAKAQTAAVVAEAKPDPGRDGDGAPGQTAAKSASVFGPESDPASRPADALGQAKTKDTPAVEADAGQGQSSPGKAPNRPGGNDIPVAESKSEPGPDGAEAPGHAGTKAVPAVTDAKADQGPRPAAVAEAAPEPEPGPGPAKAKDVPPAVAEAIDEVTHAGVPGQAQTPVQDTTVPAGDGGAVVGEIPAGPAAEALKLHVADLWPGGESGSGQSPSGAVAAEVPAPTAPRTAEPVGAVGAVGAQSGGVAAAGDGHSGSADAAPFLGTGSPSDVVVSFALDFGATDGRPAATGGPAAQGDAEGGGGAAGVPDRVVPGSASGKANGSTATEKAVGAGQTSTSPDAAASVVTDTQGAAKGGQDRAAAEASARDAAADGVAHGPASGPAHALDEALAAFAPALSEGGGGDRLGPQAAAESRGLGGSGSDMFAPEHAWPATMSDLVFL